MRSRHFITSIVTTTAPPTANTEWGVTHGLTCGDTPTIPRGVIPITRNAAGIIYDGGTANTTSTYYLKCDTGNTTFTLLFIG